MTLFDAPVPADPEGGSALGDSRLAESTYRMVVAYDGTDFRGFAAQAGEVRTVGGVLADALERVVRRRVDLVCAGRTDAGVHAWGQVVSFAGPVGLDPKRVLGHVNSMLAPEVVIRSCDEAPADFDARYSSRWRWMCSPKTSSPVVL